MQQNILAYVSIDKTLTIIDLTDDMKPNPKPVVLKGNFWNINNHMHFFWY